MANSRKLASSVFRVYRPWSRSWATAWYAGALTGEECHDVVSRDWPGWEYVPGSVRHVDANERMMLARTMEP